MAARMSKCNEHGHRFLKMSYLRNKLGDLNLLEAYGIWYYHPKFRCKERVLAINFTPASNIGHQSLFIPWSSYSRTFMYLISRYSEYIAWRVPKFEEPWGILFTRKDLHEDAWWYYGESTYYVLYVLHIT